jgi:anthranilate synthase component 1
LAPEFDAFAEAYAAGRPQVVHVRRIDDLETPVSAYLKLGQGRPYAFMFESVEGGAWRGRYSILTLAPDLIWRCRGDIPEVSEGEDRKADRFRVQPRGALKSLREVVARSRFDLPDEIPTMASGLFGAIGYDVVRLAEPVGEPNPDPLNLPDAVMTRPSIVLVFDAIAQEIVIATPVWPSEITADRAYAMAQARLEAIGAELDQALPAQPQRTPRPAPGFEAPVSRAAYADVVKAAKAYIGAGDIFQVVASHRQSAPFTGDPFSFYRSLKRLNPSPFMFYMNMGDFQLAGSSPEILVRVREGRITIRPIAGTRPRGRTPEEDLALEAELLADPKERAEHLMLLDLGRNDVGRVASLGRPGSNAAHAPNVRVTESFAIERYSHVMHIVSNVEGDAPEGLDPVDAILAALPAGTLSGAPKVRAMQIIDELENEKRGIGYGGAAGYISANGAVDTCIVLRTALIKDGRIYVQSGGGLVADSDPDAEYDETMHKARAVVRAAEEAWRFG